MGNVSVVSRGSRLVAMLAGGFSTDVVRLYSCPPLVLKLRCTAVKTTDTPSSTYVLMPPRCRADCSDLGDSADC